MTVDDKPIILCMCGHQVKWHDESFGTTCDFYRCKCEGWKIDSKRSNREYLSLSGEGENE